MAARPDIRDLASNVRDAFADSDRETLLEVLTFVVKEYVVEGPPPMLVHQAETLADLQGASFAQLITAMQTRFDHPELAMFVVDGEQVSVRVGGVVQPLLAPRNQGGQMVGMPVGTPTAPAAAEPPRPQPGVRVVETTLAPRPAAPAAPRAAAPAAPAATAPPPSRGLSIRGAPTGGGGGGDAPVAPPAAAAAPAAAPPPPEKDTGGGGDDASARFSLLELD
jgi:hypothetical protein